jgi:uncharacterized membrane protein
MLSPGGRALTERYEPPRAPLRDERAELAGQGSIDVMQCVSQAWEDTWRNFPVWLGVWLVGGLLMLLSALTIVGAVLVWPALFFGGVLYYLNMTDGRARFSDLFAGFHGYATILVSGLILAVLLWLISMVGNSVQMVAGVTGSGWLAGVGYAFSFAWTLLVMIRFYFAPMLWVDRGLGPVEALQESWERTRGQLPRLLGLAVMSIVITIVGLLALVVGVIPAMNMSYLLWTSAYRQTVGPPLET